MKMNIYYSLLLMMLLSVASVGCSDNNVEWESDEVPSDKITFDVSGTLDLLHDESVVVKVLTGNGSYQVDSQDKDIAKAEMVGANEIKVSAVSTSEQDHIPLSMSLTKRSRPLKLRFLSVS